MKATRSHTRIDLGQNFALAAVPNKVAIGSSSTFRASAAHFRYYPECRHLLALQYLTRWAITGLMHCSKYDPLFNHIVGAGEQVGRHVKADGFGGICSRTPVAC